MDSKDYVLSRVYYRYSYYSALEPHQCAKQNVACQHSQQTRDVEPMLVQCWPTVCNSSPTSNQHWFDALCLLVLRSIARWSGSAYITSLVVITAGGEYKPTPTQCLLIVRPASPVLASIHSVLVSTSCWRFRDAGGTGMRL